MATNGMEIAKPALPHMASVERLSKIPVIEQTVDFAGHIYGRVKDVNPLVNSVLSTAETTVKGAAGPVASRLEGPIKMVDSLLCSSLDFVETNLPMVTLPTDEIYKSSKEYILGLPCVNCACQLGQNGVRRAVECACALSEYSTMKLNGLKDSLAVQAEGKTTDAIALFTVYMYTLLNMLAMVSAWVGLGGREAKKATTTKKNTNQTEARQNGNSPVQNNAPTDEGDQHNHNENQ